MTARHLETPVSFDQFIEWLPESSEHRYELHRASSLKCQNREENTPRLLDILLSKWGLKLSDWHDPTSFPKNALCALLRRYRKGRSIKNQAMNPMSLS